MQDNKNYGEHRTLDKDWQPYSFKGSPGFCYNLALCLLLPFSLLLCLINIIFSQVSTFIFLVQKKNKNKLLKALTIFTPYEAKLVFKKYEFFKYVQLFDL